MNKKRVFNEESKTLSALQSVFSIYRSLGHKQKI